METTGVLRPSRMLETREYDRRDNEGVHRDICKDFNGM